MKIADLHQNEKEVSVATLNSTEIKVAKSIRLLKNGILKEHVTKVPALLLCVIGETIYETEKNERVTLSSGDYVNIEPNVRHWLVATNESQLLLML